MNKTKFDVINHHVYVRSVAHLQRVVITYRDQMDISVDFDRFLGELQQIGDWILKQESTGGSTRDALD